MPIYEYECRKCHAHVEALQKITDKPLTKCAKCGGRLEKQWSTAGVQFKGTGWYVTDYAGKKTDAKEEKKIASTETAAATPASSDKPAAQDAAPAKKTTATKNASSGAPGGD